MQLPKPKFTPPPVGSSARFAKRGTGGGRPLSAAQWSEILRNIERKRRDAEKVPTLWPMPPAYVERATSASFRLDGLDVTEQQVCAAMTSAGERPHLRSRQAQRLRNHAAILLHIESRLRRQRPLTADAVVRWYTSISAGLSTTSLDGPSLTRLDEVVRRINSPQHRLQAAIQEIALTYLRLLGDPLVPGFNGILARLLLRYNLGRCHLPAIIFDPAADAPILQIEPLTQLLLQHIQASCDQILAATPPPARSHPIPRSD